MNNKKLLKYFNNSCTEDERQEVEAWLKAGSGNAEYYLNLVQDYNPTPKPEYDKGKVKARLLDQVQHSENRDTIHNNRLIYRIFSQDVQWIKAAAVVLIIMLGGIGGYTAFDNIAFGRQEPVYNQHTVSAGEIDSLMLSDGTRVKLNAGTTIKYPEQFSKEHRTVYLTGEAYFEVAHDEAKPFKVHTAEITTTVLGTAFNIKAYQQDRKVRVAVTEGKVRVDENLAGSITQADQSKELTLAPDQSIQYDKQTRRLTKQEGDISNYISWKEGILIFDDEPLPQTARILERWYDVDITLRSQDLDGCVIHGKYKGETLGNVLKAISFATGITYEFAGQGVTITGGRCK